MRKLEPLGNVKVVVDIDVEGFEEETPATAEDFNITAIAGF